MAFQFLGDPLCLQPFPLTYAARERKPFSSLATKEADLESHSRVQGELPSLFRVAKSQKAWEKGKGCNLVPQNKLEAWPVLEIIRQFAIRSSAAGYYDHCKAWRHEIENFLS